MTMSSAPRPDTVTFIDLFPFGDLERGVGARAADVDRRTELDGRGGVYVWGLMLPEHSGAFLPCYVGKHEHSVLYRLAEHFHCGLPYGTHTLFSKRYLQDPERMTKGLTDPSTWTWGSKPRDPNCVFPAHITRTGRARSVHDDCTICGKAFCKQCPPRRELVEYYQKHFVACAYLLEKRSGPRPGVGPYAAKAAENLERVVQNRYPKALGRRSGGKSALEQMFAFKAGEFQYPEQVPESLRTRDAKQ